MTEQKTEQEVILDCPICGIPGQHNGRAHRIQRRYFYDDEFYNEDYVPGDNEGDEL